MSPSKKTLIVDDDKFLLDMYALKFSKAGWDTKTAETAEAALKLLRTGYEPDALLIDVVMPAMDGLELVAAMRKDKLAPRAAVIMLTNQSAPEDMAKARKLGADGYIVKATAVPSEVLSEVDGIISNKNQSK